MDVEVLTRYVKLEAMQNLDERIRRLAEYSLDLLQDPEAPEEIARGAVDNFRRQYCHPSWGLKRKALENGRIVTAPLRRYVAEYLSDAEMEWAISWAGRPGMEVGALIVVVVAALVMTPILWLYTIGSTTLPAGLKSPDVTEHLGR